MKTFVPDRTLGLQFKLIFAQLAEHSWDVARIFPWGWTKYRFHNFCKCNWGQYPLPQGCVIRGGGGVSTFPNYLNGYVCQQGRDFGMLSFTAKLGLSCCVSSG